MWNKKDTWNSQSVGCIGRSNGWLCLQLHICALHSHKTSTVALLAVQRTILSPFISFFSLFFFLSDVWIEVVAELKRVSLFGMNSVVASIGPHVRPQARGQGLWNEPDSAG